MVLTTLDDPALHEKGVSGSKDDWSLNPMPYNYGRENGWLMRTPEPAIHSSDATVDKSTNCFFKLAITCFLLVFCCERKSHVRGASRVVSGCSYFLGDLR